MTEFDWKEGLFAKADASVLIVLLHAYNHKPKSMEKVAEVIREQCPESDIFVPTLPVSTFSLADPEKIANELVSKIGEIHQLRHQRILLVGHSLGAVMVRKVWALAHGATPSGELGDTLPWAEKIERIILLAPLSRGWMVSSALSPFKRLGWALGSGWGNFCRFVLHRDPLIFGFRRGAPFLTTARLQCLAVASALRDGGATPPITVQLIGTVDDYVAPTDSLDLATGQDFYYLEVPEATHLGIVTLEEGEGENGALEKFRTALTADADTLGRASLARDDVFDLFDVTPDDHDTATLASENRSVRHLVFVIHGIRDRGFWTRRIAGRIKEIARRNNESCRSVTSTYGYFPMGPFLLPWMRRAKVEWLLDQYVASKALYPASEFAYVGHSNGTYLLAKAIELCPAIRFKRVVFAGSVVRCRHDWNRFVTTGGTPSWQVEQILNYVATADWVVAIFPHGLERLRVQDLGGAGHLGFTRDDTPVTNIEYVVGGHGAALRAKYWDEMSAFILEGTTPQARLPDSVRSATVTCVGLLAPILLILLLILGLGIGYLLLIPLGLPVLPAPHAIKFLLIGWATWTSQIPGWIFAVLFALYLSLLRIVVTRA